MAVSRWTGRDLAFLRRALRLASLGEGQTSPNPMVGAVLVRSGRVVGSGYHTRAGEPHAEIGALRQAGQLARGAALYVNLEPCCHFGRTPPCVDALIGAGIREVVASMRDPDPRVTGRGFRALRAAGIRVRVGAEYREAYRLNERFLRYVKTGLPFVTLKAGVSLDGRIATRGGDSRWITSREARSEGRSLRRDHDAVLVGVNTVLADDPRLTVPGRSRKRCRGPVRVVLDARLRTPSGARLLNGNGDAETVIIAIAGAPPARRRRLENAGAFVLEVPGRNGRVSLRAALVELGRRGVRSVLVEGGSEVLGSALDERIGDRLVLFVANKILGGRDALPVFGGLGARRLREAVRVLNWSLRSLGKDVVFEGGLLFPASRPGG